MNTGISEISEVILLSAKVAFCCVLLCLPLAVLGGWWLARKNFPGKSIVEGLLNLPLVMPPVTAGYFLLLVFGANGYLGSTLKSWGLGISFTWYAAVIASAFVSMPLFLRAVRISMEMVDPKLEEASRTLGFGPVWSFLKVTLPLALPGIAAGAVLCFARSMGEFGATITFAGNIQGQTRTLPLAIYSLMQVPGKEGQAMGLVLLSAVLSLAAFWISEIVLRRKRREVMSR